MCVSSYLIVSVNLELLSLHWNYIKIKLLKSDVLGYKRNIKLSHYSLYFIHNGCYLNKIKQTRKCKQTFNRQFENAVKRHWWRNVGPKIMVITIFRKYMRGIVRKQTFCHLQPKLTQIRLHIRSVWSQSTLSAWRSVAPLANQNTVKPRWLEPLWDHENLFEIWVVQAIEG